MESATSATYLSKRGKQLQTSGSARLSMDRTVKARDSSGVERPGSAKVKKTKLPTTYKDYQIKEEKARTQKRSNVKANDSQGLKAGGVKKPAQTTKAATKKGAAPKPGKRQASRTKSRERARSQSEGAHEFKARVQTQFNNFMH